MKKRLLVVAMVLGLTLSFTCSGWAEDETDIHCCCDALCYYNFTIKGPWQPAEVFTMSFYECNIVEDIGLFSAKDICEAPLYLIKFCNDRLGRARAELEETVIGELQSMWYYKSEGSCVVEEVECPIDFMLGEEDEALDILRQFRDEVLGKSEKGGKLIEAYYNHGDVLIQAFEANPAIEVFARDILEKTIERLLTASGGEQKLLTDEIAADIEILADELDVVVKSPGLKKTLRQIKGDVKEGKLF